jgi:ATP-dependent helicase/nuclease subunit B
MQMQLLVYLKDAMEYEKKLNNDKNVLPAAGLYFNIDDPYIFFENASKKLEEYRMIHDEDARDDEAILRDLVYNEQLAQFQMSGIVNMEENVLQAVDEKLEESNKSQIVKVSMKKDGNPDSRSQTLDQDTYIKLINHVADTADKLKEQLLSGNIDLNPTCDACSWCAYKGICRFDTTLGDKYKELEDVNYNNISDYLEK